MPIKWSLTALAAACLLAGCTSDIDTLRTTQGTGSPPQGMHVIFGDPAPDTYIMYFDFDESKLGPQGRLVIDQVMADARRMSEVDAWPNIAATGHSDLAGGTNYDSRLSRRRADAARDALIDGGIPAANITTTGRGEGDPAVPTPDGVAEAKNRRVVVVIAIR